MILSLIEATNLVKLGVSTIQQMVQAVREARVSVRDSVTGELVEADALEAHLVALVTAQTKASINAAARIDKRHEDDGA